MSHFLAPFLSQSLSVLYDPGFTTQEILAPFDSSRNAEVRAPISRPRELEVVDESRLLTLRQRIESLGGPGHVPVGSGRRRRDELLVPEGHVQDRAPPRYVQPLVAVRQEEVGIQRAEVEVDHADSLGAVDNTDDPGLLARLGQLLEREPNPR